MMKLKTNKISTKGSRKKNKKNKGQIKETIQHMTNWD